MGHIAELSDSARPRNTSRPLLKVNSRRGLRGSSTSLPAPISALRKGPSNFLQKFDSSLPSLVSITSSHRLPQVGKAAMWARMTLMRSVSGKSMNVPRAHWRGKINSAKRWPPISRSAPSSSVQTNSAQALAALALA
ncbi:hypothetical protein D3C78_1509790 [compost metagenome]